MNSQTSDPSDTHSDQGYIQCITGRSLFKKVQSALFFVFAFILIVVSPATAHAGIFSFVSSLFGNDRAVVEEHVSNSQTIELLHAARNVDPNPAKGGGDITVVGGTALLPDLGPSGTLADIEDQDTSSDQISLYVVREGDSLSQVAEMFGVTTNTIIWANDIKHGDLIVPGQTLVIFPLSGINHIVEKDDTMQSIAKKYKGDVDEIAEYNNIALDTSLAIGETVFIPDGEMEIPKVVVHSVVRGTNVPAYDGYYMRPIDGGVKTQGLHGYNAVDLAAPIGTPIYASASGDVIIVRTGGWNGGYGNYIVIKHPNGTQTLYAHTSENIVKTGWHVVKGQVIGYIGSTGKSTGPHLHFEIRGAVNPF